MEIKSCHTLAPDKELSEGGDEGWEESEESEAEVDHLRLPRLSADFRPFDGYNFVRNDQMNETIAPSDLPHREASNGGFSSLLASSEQKLALRIPKF